MTTREHGNFHFRGDWIEFRSKGHLLLHLRDLEFVVDLLELQAINEGRDSRYYWRQFNDQIQKLIDDKVNELDPPGEGEQR